MTETEEKINTHTKERQKPENMKIEIQDHMKARIADLVADQRAYHEEEIDTEIIASTDETVQTDRTRTTDKTVQTHTIDKTDTTHTTAPDHRAEKTCTMTNKMKGKETKIDLEKITERIKDITTHTKPETIHFREVTIDTEVFLEINHLIDTNEAEWIKTHTKPETTRIKGMTIDTRIMTVDTGASLETDKLTDTKEVGQTLETRTDTHQYHLSLRAL